MLRIKCQCLLGLNLMATTLKCNFEHFILDDLATANSGLRIELEHHWSISRYFWQAALSVQRSRCRSDHIGLKGLVALLRSSDYHLMVRV